MSDVPLKPFCEAPEEVASKLLSMLNLADKGEKGEAENALAMAQSLALKYHIDLSTVDKADLGVMRPTDAITEETIKTAKGKFRRPPCNKYLVLILENHFNVDIVWRGSVLYLIGRASSVKFATYVYKFLHGTFLRLWREEVLANGTSTHFRDTFFLGLWKGLDEKLTKEAPAVKQKTFKEKAAALGVDPREIERSYGVMVMSDEDKIKQETAQRHPVITYSKTKQRAVEDYDLFRSAKEKGTNIQIAMPLSDNNAGGLGTPTVKLS
jgi:hypothetical protein